MSMTRSALTLPVRPDAHRPSLDLDLGEEGTASLILAPDYILPSSDPEGLLPDFAVLVQEGRIAAIDLVTSLIDAHPDVAVERLHDCIILPGLINAHQQGRALTAAPLTPGDDLLDNALMVRLARTSLDPYPLALVAATDMLSHGVTTALHAGASQGTGDYEGELRAAIRGYLEAGLRTVICVSALDQGQIVSPSEDLPVFLDRLSPELSALLTEPSLPTYAGSAEDTIALMGRLQAEFGAEPTLSFRYALPGPQYVSDAFLSKIAADAKARGIGLHMILYESQVDWAVCQCMYPDGVLTRLDRLGLLSPDLTLVQGVWLSASEIELLAARGVCTVSTPGSNLRLRHGIARLGPLLRAGIPVALGTNNRALADDEDMLSELRLAAGLARVTDISQGGPWDDRPTTAEQFGMLTENGARAIGLAGIAGRLVVGGHADLMALSLQGIEGPSLDLDASLIDNILNRASARDVCLTMVAGEVRYREGALQGIDRECVSGLLREALTYSRAAADPAWPELWSELRAHLRYHYGAKIKLARQRLNSA